MTRDDVSLELFKETVHDTSRLLRRRQSRAVQGNSSSHEQVADDAVSLELFKETVHDTSKLPRRRQSRAVQGNSS